MRKIIHFVHTSLDGFIEGPDGAFDWPVMSPELSAYGSQLNEGTDTFLYGRVVWEMMSGFWPQAESMSDHPHDLAFAPIWRETAKLVVSTTLEKAGWNTTVIDSAEALADLKQQPGGNLLLTGGAALATSVEQLGLLDERHIVVHPVVLGGGKRLFPEGLPRRTATLVESRPLDDRVVLLRHALV
ncbi:dihydrofolate reductase family protein [Kribbella sp. CA-293567]|uniref:dihydrofolate reductase family protein n=1 Tax=Kribbella sp. CA-293567 TaxID=3002436 RepID=UPI0022DD69FA|nr:dihydrofolate reductase family protein [Kribbella sp. CA-293567]WBQ06130.1 dihydrofolate reductase family protein [Kribbella sp. CA-293567]